MSANNEIPNIPGLRGFGARSVGQGAPRTSVPRRRRYNPSKSLVGQLLTTNDHAVLLASVRCWTSHSDLTYVLDGDFEQSVVLIEDLGVERRRAILALAKTQSKGIEGLRLKNNVLMFIPGSYEETVLLLRSYLLDCDRVIASQDGSNSLDREPELAVYISKFFETMKLFVHETDRYDDCEDDESEAERSDLFLIMERLTIQLAATIDAIAQHPAGTFADLAAKLTVFEMCDQNRAGRSRLLLLSRAMFRDFDKLLRQHVKKNLRLRKK